MGMNAWLWLRLRQLMLSAPAAPRADPQEAIVVILLGLGDVVSPKSCGPASFEKSST